MGSLKRYRVSEFFPPSINHRIETNKYRAGKMSRVFAQSGSTGERVCLAWRDKIISSHEDRTSGDKVVVVKVGRRMIGTVKTVPCADKAPLRSDTFRRRRCLRENWDVGRWEIWRMFALRHERAPGSIDGDAEKDESRDFWERFGASNRIEQSWDRHLRRDNETIIVRQFPHRKAPGFFLFIDCSRSQKQSFAVVGLTQNPATQIFQSCLYKANFFSETDSDLSQRRGAFDTTYLAFPEYIHNNSSYK